MGKKKGGWFAERARHALAAKGIKTKEVSRGFRKVMDRDRKEELERGISRAEQAGDDETAKDLTNQFNREAETVEVVEEVAVKEASKTDSEEEKEETKDKKKGGLRW